MQIASNADPPTTHRVEKPKKPSLFSSEWWAHFFSALKFHKYSARDWMIWNVSSWATYGTIFGLFNPVWSWITVNAPWIPKALSAILAGLKFLWVGLLALVTGILNTLFSP